MRQFVESLGRLYSHYMVSEEKIRSLFADRKIDELEMKYILSRKPSSAN